MFSRGEEMKEAEIYDCMEELLLFDLIGLLENPIFSPSLTVYKYKTPVAPYLK